MKIVKGFIFLVYLPCFVFALSKNSGFNELIISPNFSLEDNFDFNNMNNFDNDILRKKSSNQELHFTMLNFNESKTNKKTSFQFLPMYDFSKESEIEDYKNNLKICAYCFRLFQIKFDFF